MTPLRRAPREVYRVYTEEEFFDGGMDEEPFASAISVGTGERRLRRLAGAALLVGAVGAVGGIVVATSVRPVRGSKRRSGTDVRAPGRTAITAPASARVAAHPDAHTRPPHARSQQMASIIVRGSGPRQGRMLGTRERSALWRHAGVTRREAVLVPATATPRNLVRATVRQTSEGQQPRAEFGFEQ
jgi:hypothetical protein